ncbi:MAG TPA: sialate O-acetylesterase [Chthonomonadales bacterium]|nr:sialate O-acetylesterase [Chthonomonadales bacterium]
MRQLARAFVPALCAAMLLALIPAQADIRLHSLFTDGAVLQRNQPIRVWGTAREGERVTVRFAGQSASTVAVGGRWMVQLRPMPAGGPYVLTATGDNIVDIHNVMLGDVWVCSGQSNMQWPLSQTENAEAAIAASSDPGLRLYTVPLAAAPEPVADVNRSWQVCTPATVRDFSAVAYYFGRELRRQLNVPIGLINTSYGGTPAEAWTRLAVLERDPSLRYLVENHRKAVAAFPDTLVAHTQTLRQHSAAVDAARREGREPPTPPQRPGNPEVSPWSPGGLYNAMIAPLLPFPIKGVIWYQGESNAGRAWEYRRLFPTMIRNWRQDWSIGDFPFLFVQLAPFMAITPEPTESAWAELREAQLNTMLTVPKTGMAVITDLGDEKDIHPRRKEGVGKRLAYAALRVAYERDIVGFGPIYRSMRVRGNRAVLRFDHVGGGLVAQGGSLTGFTVAGADRRWHNATAEIEGNTVVVTSPRVPRPVAVRFGWANFPVVNLYNRAGLPATPFRTDDWPLTTQPRAAR